MNEPSIRKPTKKTFHFPKGANAEAVTDDKQAEAPAEATVKAKAAAKPKASRSKSTSKVDAAPKADAEGKGKAAPKEKAAAKPKAAPKEKAASASVAATEKPRREKKEPVKKEKVVRDSFTMPKSDYAKIAALKQKCLDAGVSVKKSEVLRAGLLLLEGATSSRLLAAISAVETVKTGRPSKA